MFIVLLSASISSCRRTWRNSTTGRVVWCNAILFVFLVACVHAAAQVSPTPIARVPSVAPTASPTPLASPTPSLEHRFLKNILLDQRAIWTSPFHLHGDDAKWLIPLGVTTAGLIATDRRTAGALDDNNVRLNVSRDISYLGSVYGTGAVAGIFYLVGRKTQNERARETGILGGEALIDGYAVGAVVKTATGRLRPREEEPGDFFEGGRSFPSGHAISAWALATVVAHEYRDNRLVQISAYGLAAAVGISRFTGRNHFLSDVLVGSVTGYGIGRYVYRSHHDEDAGQTTTRLRHMPIITPVYNRQARSYGVALSWKL